MFFFYSSLNLTQTYTALILSHAVWARLLS